ncbi:hypothetical protein LEMLEM_LOCUS5154 [Lemmus lemmus]
MEIFSKCTQRTHMVSCASKTEEGKFRIILKNQRKGSPHFPPKGFPIGYRVPFKKLKRTPCRKKKEKRLVLRPYSVVISLLCPVFLQQAILSYVRRLPAGQKKKNLGF